MTSRHVNGFDPEMSKLLKEMQDPEVMAIMNHQRPRNREEARRMFGAKNVKEDMQAKAEKAARVGAFRSAKCDEWIEKELQAFFPPWMLAAVKRWRWAFKLSGIRIHIKSEEQIGIPVTFIFINWMGWSLSKWTGDNKRGNVKLLWDVK